MANDNINKQGVWTMTPIEQIGTVKILKDDITVNPNLVINMIAGGRTVVDGPNAVHSTGEDADTYFKAKCSQQLKAGDVVTVSCDVSGFPDNNYSWNFPFWTQSSGLAFFLKNGHVSGTFTVPAGATATTDVMFDDNGGGGGFTRSQQIPIKIFNFKIELGSKETPFIPAGVSALSAYTNPVEAEDFYEI